MLEMELCKPLVSFTLLQEVGARTEPVEMALEEEVAFLEGAQAVHPQKHLHEETVGMAFDVLRKQNKLAVNLLVPLINESHVGLVVAPTNHKHMNYFVDDVMSRASSSIKPILKW